MALLFATSWDADSPYGQKWQDMLRDKMPGLDLRVYPDRVGDLDDIDGALVWAPPEGLMASLPNLKLIHSTGMGVDHIFDDTKLPTDVPVARVVDDDLIERMSEYCLHAVLHYHREADRFDIYQRDKKWEVAPALHARDRRIGVMGVGEIGSDIVHKLMALNFNVAGWGRSAKHIDGMASFSGPPGLKPFLTRSEIVICLLPLTPETENILNAEAFAALPKGAVIINAARGGHIVDSDLIAALDSGHLGFAQLDVFRTEPLPDDHPFWGNPKIRITPHNAGVTNPETAVEQIVANYKRAQAGEPVENWVDPERGY